jgi:hypothetical protein
LLKQNSGPVPHNLPLGMFTAANAAHESGAGRGLCDAAEV